MTAHLRQGLVQMQILRMAEDAIASELLNGFFSFED